MPKLLPLTVAFMLLLPAANQLMAQPEYEAEIRKPAIALVNSLSLLQKRSALLAFDDTSRVKWNNLPVGLRARVGISVGNMNDDQRRLLHRILSASLSSQGYLKATSIMHLDNMLNWYYDSLFYKKEIDSAEYKEVMDLKWSHRNYYLAFFGLPTDSTWGYKIEGHHLSINFTFARNKLSVTPMFVGTDPAAFPNTEYAGWRVLGQEEDLGIKLINKLSPAQRKKATMSQEVPEDIITSAESGKRLVDYWGLPAAEMNQLDKAVLKYIIREFVFNLQYDKATAEYDKIMTAGVEKIWFGWIGSYVEGKPYYYILNGPTFIIELDNRNGNHIHAIWREKGNEFGGDILKRDILKKHYLTEKH